MFFLWKGYARVGELGIKPTPRMQNCITERHSLVHSKLMLTYAKHLPSLWQAILTRLFGIYYTLRRPGRSINAQTEYVWLASSNRTTRNRGSPVQIRRCPATVNASEQWIVNGDQKLPFNEITLQPRQLGTDRWNWSRAEPGRRLHVEIASETSGRDGSRASVLSCAHDCSFTFIRKLQTDEKYSLLNPKKED